MELSKQTQEALVRYVREAYEFGVSRDDFRDTFEELDREYHRTANITEEHRKNKARNRAGEKRVLQDVTVPLLAPQTESAHAYLVDVFLTGHPIFATVASPQNSTAGDMMDAVNEAHQRKFKWVRNLAMALRNGLKYNRMAVEVSWESRNGFGLSRQESGAFTRRTTKFEGNVIRNLDVYNTFCDTRVPVAEVHERGEFAGYVEPISRVELKQLLIDLPQENQTKEARTALECGMQDRWYFVPDVTERLNHHDQTTREFNWAQWAAGGSQNRKRPINYHGAYEKTVLYARIIPEDFDLNVPAKRTPQIWKFIYINGKVLIYAERLQNAHDYLPIVFGCPKEDGLRDQTPSFAEELVEMQDMASALWNIRIATARRNVSDRMLYNPLFIRQEDINSSSASAKIPVRTGQYLDDIRKAVFQIPFNADAANSVIPDASQVIEFSRSLSGISRPLEGQFMKGNRTLGEYEDIRGNGDLRTRVMAIFLQDQFFEPIKEIIKYNVLQFVKPGQVYFAQRGQVVDINPQVLQDAALDFRMSDGMMSSAKIADTEFLSQILQLALTNQEMNARYDVPRLVGYLGSLRNIPDLETFAREQEQPPAQPAPPTQGAVE